MSCGFLILISGHKRFCYRLSTPLYHQVSSGNFGDIKTIEESVAETKRLQKLIEKLTLEKTKISKKKLKKIYKKKFDWFMTADKALKLGVVDEIL
jgi:ATP-dependent Clp protease protease subunit